MSSAVVKVSERLVGMAVLRSISLVITPPLVSIPRDSGVTSISRTSLRSPLMHACLQGCAHCHDLVGVDALVGLAAGQLLDELSNGGHTGGATDQDDVGQSRRLDTPASLMTSWNGLLGALEQVAWSVPRTWRGSASRPGGWGLSAVTDRYCREMLVLVALDSSFLACSAASCRRCRAILSLDRSAPVLALTCSTQPVDDALVPVVATEAVVTAGGAHLDGGEAVVVLADLQQGDVEGTATEVEDQDELVFLALVQAVGQGCGGGLVDDAQDVQACDLAGFLGGLTLSVVEVCGNGDDGVGDRARPGRPRRRPSAS